MYASAIFIFYILVCLVRFIFLYIFSPYVVHVKLNALVGFTLVD